MSGVLSPRRRLYEPEAAGFRPRRTKVRLGRKPLCGLAHRKNTSFMNWKLFSTQIKSPEVKNSSRLINGIVALSRL
jgi:hypothetical protein